MSETCEVREWIRATRRKLFVAGSRPARVVVGDDLYAKIERHLRDHRHTLGYDVAAWDGVMLFQRIPIVRESDVLVTDEATVA